MHVLHTDINSFLIKNNLNTHHSNSLPIRIILITTSAFIFSMSEYFLKPWIGILPTQIHTTVTGFSGLSHRRFIELLILFFEHLNFTKFVDARSKMKAHVSYVKHWSIYLNSSKDLIRFVENNYEIVINESYSIIAVPTINFSVRSRLHHCKKYHIWKWCPPA